MTHRSTRGLHRKRLALLLALLLALGVIVAACGGDDSSGSSEPAPAEPAAPADPAPAEAGEAPSGDPIVFGFAVALSGGINFYDGPIINSAELAADEINAAGGLLGRPVEIVSADMASDPAQSGTAGEEVLEQGADFMVVSCDFDMGQGAARVATENNILSYQCAGGELAGFEGLGGLHYNIYPGTPTEGAHLAQHAIDNGITSTFLLVDTTIAYDTDLCMFYAQAFETFGGTVLGEEVFTQGDATVTNQVTAMQNANPESVMVCSYAAGAPAAIKQIRDVSDIPIYTGIAQDGIGWTEGIPGASDVYIAVLASIVGDDPNPARAEFLAKYEAATGNSLENSIGMQGYQMMYAYATAIERAGSIDTGAVQAELDMFTDVELLGQPFTYTPTCHKTVRPMVIMQLQGGELSYSAEPTPQSIPEGKC